MKVRKLNNEGLKGFHSYIDSLRQGVMTNIPTYMLDDDRMSEVITLDLDVECQEFETRYDMGLYLTDLFEAENIQAFMGDSGFWSWFALLWFVGV